MTPEDLYWENVQAIKLMEAVASTDNQEMENQEDGSNVEEHARRLYAIQEEHAGHIESQCEGGPGEWAAHFGV